MATPMTATELVTAFRRWGVPVRERAGWRIHNHNDTQPWGPVHGILLHHTGDDAPDDADERVLSAGRSDLPGPLCNWGMTDAGVAVMIGNGTAYHAGQGASNVLGALLADAVPPRPGPDAVTGNARLYGQETMYSGAKRMTAKAYRSTVRAFAAICEHHGWSASSCIGHKEWTTRKIDPGSLDMDAFRADVQAALNAGPADPPEGDDMSDADVAKVLAGVKELIAGRDVAYTSPTEPDLGLRGANLAEIGIVAARHAYNTENISRALSGKVDAIGVTLGQVLARQAGQVVDVDEASLAANLAPLLAAQVPAWAGRMATEDLQAIVAGLGDELARRLGS